MTRSANFYRTSIAITALLFSATSALGQHAPDAVFDSPENAAATKDCVFETYFKHEPRHTPSVVFIGGRWVLQFPTINIGLEIRDTERGSRLMAYGFSVSGVLKREIEACKLAVGK
jgi:hypothetical protein